MSGGRNPILTRVFAVVGIAVVTLGTLVTLMLIYDIWNPPFFRTAEKPVDPRFIQMRVLAEGIQPDNFTVAYRSPAALSAKDDFHKIKLPGENDKVSLCITCHGYLPHAREIETRSFLNKHSADIACETCHAGGEGQPYFRWYNVSTGDLVKSIKITETLTLPDYKIIALYGPEVTSYDRRDRIKEAEALLSKASAYSASERREAIKPFHGSLKKTDEALKCEACHTAEGRPFLPLASLGYPERRIQLLMTSEIIGMLTKYKEFYLPSFLYNKNAEEGAEAK